MFWLNASIYIAAIVCLPIIGVLWLFGVIGDPPWLVTAVFMAYAWLSAVNEFLSELNLWRRKRCEKQL